MLSEKQNLCAGTVPGSAVEPRSGGHEQVVRSAVRQQEDWNPFSGHGPAHEATAAQLPSDGLGMGPLNSGSHLERAPRVSVRNWG